MTNLSNKATYRANGEQVFDVFFATVEAGDGEKHLYGLRDLDDRQRAIDGFTRKGLAPSPIGHRDAFMMILAGTPAWYHMGDVPSDEVWAPLTLNNPLMAAA